MTSDERLDLAAAHALGLFCEDDAEALKRSGDSYIVEELRSFEEIAAGLAQAAWVTPPEHLKNRMLAAIRRTPRPLPEVQPGMRVLRAGEGVWLPTRFPGVTYQQLYVDPATAMATSLLRLEPGGIYPAHRHAAEEQCYVVEGEARIGDIDLRPGDYERAEPDTVHHSLTTSTGCVLLIIASQHDEFLPA